MMNKILLKKLQKLSGGILCVLVSLPVYALTPEEQAIPRIVQLSKIPTTESVNEVIALAQEGSTNLMRQQFVFTALIQIGPSVAGDNYAKSILDTASSPIRSVQGALGYLAEHPAAWMIPYAEQYLADTFDGETRSMAAYLAGALNMTEKVDIIKEVISNSSYGAVRRQAAYGLAPLISTTDYEVTIDATDLSDWDKQLAKQLNVFLQADEATKANKIGSMLKRSEFIFPLAAMRYMLVSNNIELLKRYVVQGNDVNLGIRYPTYQTLLRILGYDITGNINEVVVSKKALL